MAKPKKTGHKSHDKIMEQDWEAKEGHNSGVVNPEVQKLFSDHEAIQESIKTLQKDQKSLRVRAKDEFGIPTRVFTIEMSMRKLDPNVRAEIEQAHADLKAMTGYQMALNLLPHSEGSEGEENDPVEAASKKVTNIKKGKKKKAYIPQPVSDDDDDTYGLTEDDMNDSAA